MLPERAATKTTAAGSHASRELSEERRRERERATKTLRTTNLLLTENIYRNIALLRMDQHTKHIKIYVHKHIPAREREYVDLTKSIVNIEQ